MFQTVVNNRIKQNMGVPKNGTPSFVLYYFGSLINFRNPFVSEQQGNGPYSAQCYKRVDHSRHNGHCTEQPCNEVKREYAYQSPVQGSDNNESQSNLVYNSHDKTTFRDHCADHDDNLPQNNIDYALFFLSNIVFFFF